MMKLRTLLLTAATLTTLYSCQNNNQPLATPQSLSSPVSNWSDYGSDTNVMKYFIVKDSANKMIQSYLTSIGSSATTQDSSLNSLIFDADALRAYLSDTSIKNVKLMFAHTLEYINAGNSGTNAGYKSGALTLVVAGYDQDGNYILGPTQMVPDRARPCPHYCPLTGTASSNLLE